MNAAAKTSFSRRLSSTVVLITSILFIVAIGVAAVSSHLILADEAHKSAENLLDATIKEIENKLIRVEVSVKNTVTTVQKLKNSPEKMYDITQGLVMENDEILGSAVAFVPEYYKGVHFYAPYSFRVSDGKVESKQLGTAQYDYFYSDWFQIPQLLGEPCWSEPYFDEGGAQEYMSTYSYPIKDDQGNVFAILTADISLSGITEFLASIRPYPSSYVSLISRSGRYVNSGVNDDLRGETVFSTQFLMGTKENEDINQIATDMMAGNKGKHKYRVGNKISFAVYGPVSNGWKASITCDYRDVLARTSKMHMILVLVVLVGLLILFLSCYSTIRKLTKPLTDMSESALSIAKGNFNTPLPDIKYDDEIRHLRNSFDYMQHSLTEYIENLKKSTAENERFESELTIASDIQMAMLSSDFPENGNLGLHAMLKPAKEVGGDLYDFFLMDKDTLYFAVGDVSGKGVPASMFMAITRSAFRFIAKTGAPMNDVVSQINNSLCDGNDSQLFVTMFVGKLNLPTGELEYCNAGHNPVIVNGSYVPVKANLALGLMPGFPYQLQTVNLTAGSRIFVYTDGITEAERSDKEQYGEERLLECIRGLKQSCSDKEVCESVVKSVHDFADGNVQNDDITVLSITLKQTTASLA